MKKILSPKSDFIFKLLFGDQRNADVLAAFLTSILDLPEDEFKEITVIDPYLKPEEAIEKWGVLDVKVQTKTGKRIDIEIQVDEQGDLEARVIFYSAKMITEQIQRGSEYGVIQKTVSIIITDFVRFAKSKAYHHKFVLFDKENNIQFTDLVEFHVLELPKLPEKDDKTKPWKWMKFLKSKKKDEFDKLAEGDEMLTKVVGKLKELSEDELTRLREEYYEKWRRDKVAREKFVEQKAMTVGMEKGIQKGMEKGIQKGMEKGIQKGKSETAKVLKTMQMSITDIAKATGLTPAEIKKL